MTDKLMHTFAVDAGDLEEKREIAGLAAPYGETITHGGKKVRFEKGMFTGADGVHLYFNHEEGLPIGLVTEFEDTDEGLKIRARISKTAKGEEVYTLLRDGVLNKFSVGFVGLESRMDDDVSVWTKVDLQEVSVVPRPAFKSAAVASVHSADTTTETELNDDTMSDSISTEVGELKEAFSDLERKVVALGTGAPVATPAVEKYNSGGEALLAAAAGDREAFAYTGSTLAGNDAATRPAWLSKELKLVAEKRPVINLFNKGALPTTGMSYTYPQVSATSGTVTQVAEGADLPFLGASVNTATSTIELYGGYTELTRMAIERSDVGLLDLHIRHMYNQYAKATEAAVRTKFIGLTGTQTTALGATYAAATAVQWVNVIRTAKNLVDDNGQGAEAKFALVSRDVFGTLINKADTTNRPLFSINGDGSNTYGTLNIGGNVAVINGMPILEVGSLPASTFYVASPEALIIREDATKSLQDENIRNLSKAFSIYGYLSVDVVNKLGLVKVTAS